MKSLGFKLVLLSSLACLNAFAEGAFIGIDTDYSFRSEHKIKNGDDENVKFNDGQFGVGLKAGYDFDGFRVYAKYSYDPKASKYFSDAKEDVKWETHKFVVGADYTPAINDDFKFVAGGYAGYVRQNFNLRPNNSKYNENFSINGIVLGAKVGGIYNIDKHNEIEFGYNIEYAKYSNKALLDGGASNNHYETNHGLYLGYNYKF